MPVTIEALADEMYALVSRVRRQEESEGRRSDEGDDRPARRTACSKDDCKHAIRILMDSGRCVYSYLGGSYITLPPKEGTLPGA